MGSFGGNHEIQEAKDEHTSSRLKPPMLKKGYNKTLEDDINKLFESVNLRTCKSLDLSECRRNPSKKPMRSNGSHSPGIGFSEPVSLKQALRGLCISQAAEMAALKRSSMPASPRISEVGRISNKYRSVVVETNESGTPVFEGGERRIEISLVPEENKASSSKFSPSFGVSPIVKNLESGSSRVEVPLVPEETTASSSVAMPVTVGDSNSSPRFDDNRVVENLDNNHVVKGEDDLNGDDNKALKQEKKFFGSNKVANVPSKDSAACMKAVDKPAPKLRRKSRLQNVSSSSSVVKGKKDVNLPKSTSRAVKPVIRNKNVVIKKPKKVVVLSSNGNSQTSDEMNSNAKLICQKCQCPLTDTIEEDTSAVKTNIPCKGDISQSSKDSICDFSSSTNTSLSDDSNLSGSSCGNRPHMSKDMRWQAINHVKKQHGFLGLNHFNLLKKLGSGDIGTVYLAELVGTNCPFAIKVMDNEFLARRKKMVRAQTEREILRMLDHPFLPTLYSQFTSDNLSCLVMEFCPGGDLHVLRQKQPGRYFPEQAARFYVAEVLLALEYLHMLGIVYRDLKPENILVREDGHIMLTDFDLSLRCSVNPTLLTSSTSAAMDPARISGPCAGSNCIDPFCTAPTCKMSCFSPRLFPTSRRFKAEALAAQARSLPQLVAEPTEARSNSFVGTHEYLAPEIIKGEGHGSAVDWWTLGVFLYELLYGRTPFKGAGNEETLTNAVLQNLKFPDSPMVSFQARDLIRGLLVKEPENRLGTETGAAEIKRHPFFEGLNWALIRCAVPPQVPQFYAVGNLGIGNAEHLEFELF